MIMSDIVYYGLLSSERQAGVNKAPAHREHTEIKAGCVGSFRERAQASSPTQTGPELTNMRVWTQWCSANDISMPPLANMNTKRLINNETGKMILCPVWMDTLNSINSDPDATVCLIMAPYIQRYWIGSE